MNGKFKNCVRCGAETKRGARFCEECTEKMMDIYGSGEVFTTCIVCGEKLSDHQLVFCSQKCYTHLIESFKKYVLERMEFEAQKKPFRKDNSLELHIKTARENGMTYGEYIAHKHISEQGGKRQ